MFVRGIVLINIVIIFHGRPSLQILQNNCEGGKYEVFREGNIGSVGLFPWLGILRVSLQQGQAMQVALTGLILVKENYCIANAIDLAKMSKSVLQSDDSKAMFIKTDKKPKYNKVKDYLLHPEYDYLTKYTIALVELADPGSDEGPEVDYLNIRPICWPTVNYNTNNQLYAVGYTDEKMILEKMFYKLHYIDKTVCNEFYNRVQQEDQTQKSSTPYLCAYAPSSKERCVWDNGMALVSNSSGRWTLIGLGLHGPGCAAPARFLNMLNYLPWVETATSLEEISDYRRKYAFRERASSKGGLEARVNVYRDNAFCMAIRVFNNLPKHIQDCPPKQFKPKISEWLAENVSIRSGIS